MYSLIDIKNLIAVTGYPVEFSDTKESNLQELNTLPIVYIGYSTITAKNSSNPESFSAFEQFGENLIQRIETQICCEVQDLPVIWRTVYKSLQGKNNIPLEQQFSALTYQKGGMVGLENSRLRWLDIWGVQFPSDAPFNF